MTEHVSILDKAEKLSGEVRRLDLSRKGEQQAQRVRERLQTFRTALGGLSAQVRVSRAVIREMGHEFDLSGAAAGYTELAKRAEGGVLPSDRAFNAARQKIESSTAALKEQTLQVWRSWTQERLAELPTHKLPMLKQTDLAKATSRLTELRKIASSTDLGTAEIGIFTTTFQQLSEDLAEAPDVPTELLSVLDRLGGKPPLTLKELTDEEISLLRRYNIDHEIELRRKTS